MEKLLIATKNPGKFFEISEILHDLPVKLISLKDLDLKDDVNEAGDTHEENAILKALHFYKLSGLPTLGEDSGIYVDAFPDELGVKTRRFRNLHSADDKEWISYFLKEMEKIPDEKRGSRFVCHAALMINGKPYIFSGECLGVITRTLEAPLREGIPLSSCFRPNGFDKVYSALSSKEKASVSHRGRAMQKVKEFLQLYLTKH